MQKLRICLFTLLLFTFQSANAFMDAFTGVRAGIGNGKPADLWGGRLTLQQDWWGKWNNWRPGKYLLITGMWEFSIAYWHTDGDENGKDKDLGNIAAGPVLHFNIPKECFNNVFQPYFEASAAPSFHTNDHLAQRDLGSNYAFQDLLGIGFGFGKNLQYDLTFDYLHYSNASLFPPNSGIDVKYFVSFTKHF